MTERETTVARAVIGTDPCASDAVTHHTPEEPDQPACGADIDAPPEAVMFGALNPDRVTCPACRALLSWQCPDCGCRNMDEIFCYRCGAGPDDSA